MEQRHAAIKKKVNQTVWSNPNIKSCHSHNHSSPLPSLYLSFLPHVPYTLSYRLIDCNFIFLKHSQDVSYDDSIMDFNADAANGIAMEGYLYKRASNAFKTWSRYKFTCEVIDEPCSVCVGATMNPKPFHVLPPLQTLVLNPEESAGLSEEIQGTFQTASLKSLCHRTYI